MNLNHIHWDEPLAKEYLEELGGSKAGGQEYLADTQPHLIDHLPKNSAYLPPGADVGKFMALLNTQDAKAVRGCHPLDVVGMVDVFPTQLDVRGSQAIRKAIEDIMLAAQAPDVKSYVEYESGQPFSGNIGILVQDYCGQNGGSMIEHPHERGVYRVSRISPTITSVIDEDEEICREDGRALDVMAMGRGREKGIKYKSYQTIEQDEMEKVIHLYRGIRDSGLIPSSHSFQMEYGINGVGEVIFYQGRLFRPFEDKKDFPVDEDWDTRSSSAYDAFGITPEGGIEMPLAELDHEFVERYKSEQRIAYAYNAYGHRTTTDLDLQPRNLYSYLPYQSHVLEHGHYRWLQKAKIAIAGLRRHMNTPGRSKELYESMQEIGDEIRVRLFSNGIVGSVMVLK